MQQLTKRILKLNTANTRAFTLIEFLIASGIMLVIIGSTALMLASSRRSYLSTDTSLSVQNQASLAFDIMRKELAAAQNVTLNPVCANCAIDFKVPLGFVQGVGATFGAVDIAGVNRTSWWVQYRLETAPDGTKRLIRILQDAPGHDATGEVKRVIANNVDAGATDIFQLAPPVVKIKLQITASVLSSTAADTRTTNILKTQVLVHN